MNSAATSPTSSTSAVRTETDGPVTTVILSRAAARNAVDGPTAALLRDAFKRFEADDTQRVAVLWGGHGTFCAGADLKAVADPARRNELDPEGGGSGPMGPTRMALSKPLIAAIAGHAVAGGLELALLADLRVASRTAVFGVYCRRFGVPLIDGGTVRLPRLIGESRALDLILTGRAVEAEEALALGLANRVVPAGEALAQAQALAREIAAFPQHCMRNDRASVVAQHSLPLREALAQEFALGMQTLASGESVSGARRFTEGVGRHGTFGTD